MNLQNGRSQLAHDREHLFRQLRHRVWFHPEVADAVHGLPHLEKRIGIVLYVLGAHGSTSVSKPCQGAENRGWLRSPLGGNGGMQYYLWWAPQGNQPTKGLPLAAGDILVRAVRDHDNHTRLDSGAVEDYLLREHGEPGKDVLECSPWTDDQLRFVESDEPVRFLVGRPGAGKTTALWKAIDARDGQRVLYLTWSRELAKLAEEHFASYAPQGVTVIARDFLSFLGEVCGKDVERVRSDESLRRFTVAVEELRFGRAARGEWVNRSRALYAEIRSFLLGRAIPGSVDSTAGVDTFRLMDEPYLERRGAPGAIGRVAAQSVLKIYASIEKPWGWLSDFNKRLSRDRRGPIANIFPEFLAADEAIKRLRSGDIPPEFNEFDQVAVDEAQDLTLRETSAVLELCRAISRVSGQSPSLLIAADDGQTVRPSGFDWGALSDLVAHEGKNPSRFALEDNLRCPHRIAAVVERASEGYASLEKGRRPRQQRQGHVASEVPGHVIHVELPQSDSASALLESLEDAGMHDIVVITTGDSIPVWVPGHLRDMIMTPAMAKGRESRSVCVLDPASLLTRLNSAVVAGASPLDEQQLRTDIDQLRVALSRATETLAFIDVAAAPEAVRLSRSMLGDPELLEPEDLLDHLMPSNEPLQTRLLAHLSDARTLVAENPRRACRRISKATRLLAGVGVTSSTDFDEVIADVHPTRIALAARFLIDGLPEGVGQQEVDDGVKESLALLASPASETAYYELQTWSAERTRPPIALLSSAVALADGHSWLDVALVPAQQALRHALEASTVVPEAAQAFGDDVEKWLSITGYSGDLRSQARRLRCQAAATLLTAGNLSATARVLECIMPEDALLVGRLREAENRFEEAAEAFGRAGAREDALRTWRAAGVWEKALNFAEGADKDDLQWLVELGALAVRRPVGLEERLTLAERRRLRNAWQLE